MACELRSKCPMLLDKEVRSGTMQDMRAIATTTVLLLMLFATPAVAQQVNIRTVPPDRAREPVVIEPGDQYSARQPTDYDDYPRGPRVKFDPAFIRPLSVRTETPTSTGRAGFAGWTSPNTPVGSMQTWSDVTGWFALGFAVEWGGPPPARRPAPPPNR